MMVEKGRLFIGRFSYKADLLEELINFCSKESIQLGAFSVIGALSSVRLGYYDQDSEKYVECLNLDKKLEIVSCLGNVSLKDSKVFVHSHIMLADHSGRCYGGHLLKGASIFAAEYCMKEFKGAVLDRKYDPETGLYLW